MGEIMVNLLCSIGGIVPTIWAACSLLSPRPVTGGYFISSRSRCQARRSGDRGLVFCSLVALIWQSRHRHRRFESSWPPPCSIGIR